MYKTHYQREGRGETKLMDTSIEHDIAKCVFVCDVAHYSSYVHISKSHPMCMHMHCKSCFMSFVAHDYVRCKVIYLCVSNDTNMLFLNFGSWISF